MAEGWARHLLSDLVEPHSAGTAPRGHDPRAVQVMREAGVDISSQRSKHVSELAGKEFDFVATLCDAAAEGHAPSRARPAVTGVAEACPVFPGKARVAHHTFDDPAKATGTDEEVFAKFTRVRDEIRDLVSGLPEWLGVS